MYYLIHAIVTEEDYAIDYTLFNIIQDGTKEDCYKWIEEYNNKVDQFLKENAKEIEEANVDNLYKKYEKYILKGFTSKTIDHSKAPKEVSDAFYEELQGYSNRVEVLTKKAKKANLIESIQNDWELFKLFKFDTSKEIRDSYIDEIDIKDLPKCLCSYAE